MRHNMNSTQDDGCNKNKFQYMISFGYYVCHADTNSPIILILNYADSFTYHGMIRRGENVMMLILKRIHIFAASNI